MSLRAELVRVGLRWFLKPGSGPGVSIDIRRRRASAFARWAPRPPDEAEVTTSDLAGIPAVHVAMPDSRRGCHLLYLHGGGYVAGGPELYRHLLWRFAQSAGARVAAIDYRLGPEHPFPAALDDAVTAWCGLIAGGADPRRTAAVGDSAGGGLALALALRLRDEGLPLPGALVAMSPLTDLAATGDSLKRNVRADPMQCAEDVPFFAAAYLAGADARDPYASPLYGDPTGLPPTLIQVGSDEVLCDDSLRMAERMRAAGCTVELEVWPRMPHVFQAFATIMPEARRAIARIGLFIREHTAVAG